MFRKLCSLLIFMPIFLQGSIANNWATDARVAVFAPESKLFREIYSYNPYYQMVISKRIGKLISLWSSLSYYNATGRSTLLNNKTEIQLFPVGMGVSYAMPFFCGCKAYVGGGACYTFMHIQDHLSCGPSQITTKGGFGGIFKLGLIREYCDWRLGLFTDYHLQEINFKSSVQVSRMNADIGGFLIGISFGREF